MKKESSNPLESLYAFRRLDPCFATSGQPTEAQFGLVRQAGISVVINLAMATSDGAIAHEGHLVIGLGMAYFHIPVPFDAPTAEDFTLFCQVLQACNSRSVLVHCAMNMRVSSFMYLYRVRVLGTPQPQAREDLLSIWEPDTIWSKFIEKQLGAR